MCRIKITHDHHPTDCNVSPEIVLNVYNDLSYESFIIEKEKSRAIKMNLKNKRF